MIRNISVSFINLNTFSFLLPLNNKILNANDVKMHSAPKATVMIAASLQYVILEVLINAMVPAIVAEDMAAMVFSVSAALARS